MALATSELSAGRQVDERELQGFEDFYLSDEILEALGDVDYEDPTDVQRKSIPLILAGIDLILQSQTGTGKTAAFAIPISEMLDPNPGTVQVLALAPTRELAKQVCGEFERIGKHKGLEATAIYGGTSYEKQYKALETAQVVSATPGRLLDLLEKGKIDLSDLRCFCLDEADEMLSMGFREELDAIVEYLPEERQSILCSATVNESIKDLASGMLFYPEYITLSDDSVAAESVDHEYYKIDGIRRKRDMVRVLQYESPDHAIIFANTRQATFELTDHLKKFGYRVEVLNGELPQKEREKTLGKLRRNELDLLVATDVAARGIDISDLTHVFNYELPQDPEVYVHRIGRTGRIGKKGRAVSLLSPAEMDSFLQIKKHYDVELVEQQLPSLEDIIANREGGSLTELWENLQEIGPLPGGGKRGLAEDLLKGDVAENVDRVGLTSKLLNLAYAVSKRSDIQEALTSLPGSGQLDEADTESPETSEPSEHEPTPESQGEQSPSDDGSTQEDKRDQPDGSDSDHKRTRSNNDDSDDDQESPPKTRSDSAQQNSDVGEGHKKRRRDRSSSRDRSGDKKRRRSRSNSNSDDSDSDHRKRRRSRDDDDSPKRRRSRSSSDQNEQSGHASHSRSDQSADQSESHQQDDDYDEMEDLLGAPDPDSVEMEKMWIDVGHDTIDDESDLLDMMCYMAGMSEHDFGDIVMKGHYSFVQVREDYFHDVINALNGQSHEGQQITAEPAHS